VPSAGAYLQAAPSFFAAVTTLHAMARSPAQRRKIMSRRFNTCIMKTIGLLTLATALPGGKLFAQQQPEPVLVAQVTSVDCTLEKRIPPNALVKAKGMVTTGGYTHPRLIKLVYVTPPIDGIQDLDFMVDPPRKGGVVTQVLTELETPPLRIEHIPDWMKGVRIRGAMNKFEKPCS
jgi:hypothetical protein